jgi:hypothetical protein
LRERSLEIVAELSMQCLCSCRVGLDQTIGHRELEVEQDEVLLCAVVEVTLEASAFGIGGRDDPGSRLAQIRAQILAFAKPA